MRSWTVHLRDGAAPVLVPERFSAPAMLLGPLWLFFHRAWIAGILVGCAQVLIANLASDPMRPALALALAWFVGLSAHDLRRAALGRRRFRLAHVVAAPNADAALGRLLDHVPDLAATVRA